MILLQRLDTSVQEQSESERPKSHQRPDIVTNERHAMLTYTPEEKRTEIKTNNVLTGRLREYPIQRNSFPRQIHTMLTKTT